MIGALFQKQTTHFRVWAPKLKTIDVVNADASQRAYPLTRSNDGFFEGTVKQLKPGDRYRYRVDGGETFPDPASRYQPEGVHGPSEIVDVSKFHWTDRRWRGLSADELVIYELHVGTFTKEGTFRGVMKKLPYLKRLGVTAIEIMPVADFPGRWNWGYDGVSPFAPARTYGTPADLQELVNAAHAIGLAVLLDVVYNHLGPDGNYLGCYSNHYTSKRHKTGWGDGFNFDGADSTAVREFFIENAVHWIREFHFDGLRLDATHAIMDDSQRHFLAELSLRARKAAGQRSIVLIAEDHRRQTTFTDPIQKKGWGLDAVWADDFHHHVRRRTAGDHESYFAPFSGSAHDIAATLRAGWSIAKPKKAIAQMSPSKFVFCIQNHDQIGNRALGERLNHQIDPAAFRAVTALLLLAPQIPMLFMGQEWSASTPFLFFTDHNEELGKLVVEGRRDEFKEFSHFSNPATRKKIPSPQAQSTFMDSKLNWKELKKPQHAQMLKLVRSLLKLRSLESALQNYDRRSLTVEALTNSVLWIRRADKKGATMDVVVNLEGKAEIKLPHEDRQPIISTEASAFAKGASIKLISTPSQDQVIFDRPGAVVYRVKRSKHANGK